MMSYLLIFIVAFQRTENICITFVQRGPNVFDVGPTFYKCYTNVLWVLGLSIGPRLPRNYRKLPIPGWGWDGGMGSDAIFQSSSPRRLNPI